MYMNRSGGIDIILWKKNFSYPKILGPDTSNFGMEDF